MTRVDALPAREVALKLPSLRCADGQLAQRFARERQILARLKHSYIFPPFAAGVAEDGTPWVAMELVSGHLKDCCCDARRFTTAQRLAVFGQVLNAIGSSPRFEAKHHPRHRMRTASPELDSQRGVVLEEPQLLSGPVWLAIEAVHKVQGKPR